MITPELQAKLDHSIALLRKAERIALKYDERGFLVAFSGGKDSQALLQVVKEAGVKYFAYMSLTSVDPPEVIRFVRQHYPEVTLIPPKTSMWKIIEKHKTLPLRTRRYCCKELKEDKFYNCVLCFGIRHEESRKRSLRKEMEVLNKKIEKRYKGTQEQFFDHFADHIESEQHCIGAKEVISLSPIIDWTEKDVWDFLNDRGLPHCCLYDEGRKRIGCMFCPMSKYKELQWAKEKYKHQYHRLLQTIAKLKELNKNNTGKKASFYQELTPEQIFDYWARGLPYKKYKAKYIDQQKIDFNNDETQN